MPSRSSDTARPGPDRERAGVEPEAAPPVAFGKYRLHQRLAQGGMGEVYRASLVGELGFEKQLVIKTILPKFAGEARFIELFAAEAKTAVTLSHGNIVPIYELGRADDTFYIVMGYVDGPSVAALIDAHRRRDEPVPIAVALSIVRGVLSGLAYAHTPQPDRPAVVHRDITPRNVMVERSGQVRIVDFGIARPAEHRATMRAGSTGYMAPEQARAETVDPRADVFSVGCLLYELLTLRRAFTRKGVWSPPALDDVPTDLRPLLHDALATDPAARPADARAMLQKLGPALSTHGATFTEADLAAHLTTCFSGGQWSVSGGDDAVTPSTGVVPNPVTFATRLTPISMLDAESERSDDDADETARPPVAPLPPEVISPSAIGARPLWLAAAIGAVGLAIAIAVALRPPQPPVSASASVAPSDTTNPDDRATSPEPSSPTGDAATEPAAAEHSAPPPLDPMLDPMLSLTVQPPDALVFVDEVKLPGTSPHRLPRPTTRTATIRIEADGHQSQTLALGPDTDTLPTVTLQPAVTGRGGLVVVAPGVAWARVSVDGRDRGVTPTRKLDLDAGEHRVVVRCVPDVCPQPQVLLRRTVMIEPGETTRLSAE